MKTTNSTVPRNADEDAYFTVVSELARKGEDLREFELAGLSEVFGQTCANALMYHIGETAFCDPISFIEQMKAIFDGGARVVFLQLTEMGKSRLGGGR